MKLYLLVLLAQSILSQTDDLLSPNLEADFGNNVINDLTTKVNAEA